MGGHGHGYGHGHGHGHGHGRSSGDDEQHAGYGWLAFCATGMIASLTLYGVALEYATSGNRKLHEWSFVFVTTSIYSITAFIMRGIFGEKPTNISKYQMLTLSITSIASTFTSVRSLRYVIYPVQVLFKSCKPVPVMLFNLVLGKRYKLVKYVNVIIITAGVGLFMGGGSSSHKETEDPKADTLLLGAIMLSISLCFDGATGAYEDQLMSKNNVEPFDLMYNIQLGKAVISFCVLVATNGLNEFMHTIEQGGFALVILGLTGALGQVFVFVTISKFGALNCALIGLGRKILSLVLSFVLYGHTMNAFQTVGLGLAITAMIANFYEKGGNKGGHGGHGGPHALVPGDSSTSSSSGAPSLHLPDAERTSLLAPDIDDEDEEHHTGSHSGSHKSHQGHGQGQGSARPPVYRDDLLAQQEEGAIAGGIELSDRGNKSRKDEAKPAASVDLLDLQVTPSSYSDLPPESEQSV